MARRWPLIAVAISCCFGFLQAHADERDKPQWIVVTAPAFRDDVGPLCEHRRKQGMQVTVVETADAVGAKEVRDIDGRKLKAYIRKACRDTRGPHYVLLVGDTGLAKLVDRDKKVIPPLRGTSGRMKGKLTDHGYGCLRDGLVPDLSVGRLPARSVAEVRQMVAKILAFETDTRPGAWRRRVTVLAGAPGFGPIVDGMVENLAFSRLGKLDGVWDGRAIYHNPSSFFTLPDGLLHRRALDYVESGQALTIYLGHSNATGFYGGRAPYLNREDWGKLSIREGAGIFITFGCFGCQLVQDEGYGLAAIRNPNGPVAVVGSLDECFSTMALPAAEAMIESCAAASMPERLGEAWLKLHKGIAEEKTSDVLYGMLNIADGDTKIPRNTQRKEHLEMFILLGDPALKLPQVRADIKLTCAEEISAGRTLTVRGELPARLADASIHLELKRPLNSKPVDLEAVPKEAGAARDRLVLANHERANRFAVAARELEVKGTRFEARLNLPSKLPWPRLTLRAYGMTAKSEGVGTLVVDVKRK